MSEIQNENDKAINEYLNGQRSIDDLTEQQMEQAYKMVEDTGSLQKSVEVAEKEVVQDVKPEEVKEVSGGEQDIHKKLYQAQVEANKYKQQLESREKKLERLYKDEEYRNQELGISKKQVLDPTVDRLSDEYLGKIEFLEEKVNKLLKHNETLEEKYKREEEERELRQEQDALFDEVSRIQAEFPQLKTSVNFQKFDSDFIAWKRSIGEENAVKYLNDEKYRQEADRQGYKPSFKFEDVDKALKIYDAVGKYRKNKSAGYKTSLSLEFKDSQYYNELMKEKYSKHINADGDALSNKYREISSQPTVITRQSAPSSTDTIESVTAELERGVSNARLKEIEKFINKITGN